MATVQHPDPEAVVKRAFFLAWQACGRSVGMGVLQDRGPGMTEDQVWDQMVRKGDYPGGDAFNRNKPGDVYGDYVFGRMMKLGLKWKDDEIEYPDSPPARSYQAWAHRYRSYAELLATAVVSLRVPDGQSTAPAAPAVS